MMGEIIGRVLIHRFGNSIRRSPKMVKTKIGLMLDILGYDSTPPQILWPFFLIGAYFRSYKQIFPSCIILVVAKAELLRDVSDILKLDIAVENTSLGQTFLLDHALKETGKLIVYSEKSHPLPADIRVVSVGIRSDKSDYYASDIKASGSGSEFRICTTGQKIAIRSSLSNDDASIYSELTAFAIGQIFKIQSLKIKKSLENPF